MWRKADVILKNIITRSEHYFEPFPYPWYEISEYEEKQLKYLDGVKFTTEIRNKWGEKIKITHMISFGFLVTKNAIYIKLNMDYEDYHAILHLAQVAEDITTEIIGKNFDFP